MRYELKNYQRAAVNRVCEQLREIRSERAIQATINRDYLSQVSLSAATGSGKTVMAAGILERLLTDGTGHPDDYDRKATVLWFSDDPALNEQSRRRIERASDKLTSRTVTLDTGTLPEKFEPGKVYFLNTQKLSSSSLMTRGGAGDDPGAIRGDRSQHNFYDSLRDTLEDPEREVYLVLDEAHRGITENKAETKKKDTILRRLIGGQGSVPPIETVIGISATPKRFEDAMRGFHKRQGNAPVIVDPASVQASGLLKDTIALSYPEETGNFDTLLVTEGAAWLKRITASWDSYTTAQALEPVVPLMVVQLPDKATAEFIESVINAVKRELDLPTSAFAHVLGDHTDLEAGSYTVRYIEPGRVAETNSVRVLLAKTAISTGWDCPRAEVLVSLRPGSADVQDLTHITQLLGRMVRTPLARRIETEPALGTVYCLLPRFDGQAVQRVARMLTRSARRRPATAEAREQEVTSDVTEVDSTEVASDSEDVTVTDERQVSEQPGVAAPVAPVAPAEVEEEFDDSDYLLDEHIDPAIYDDELEDGSGGGGGRETVINPIPLMRNPMIDNIDEVVAALESLQSATQPKGVRNSFSRLFGLTREIAADKFSSSIKADTGQALLAAAAGLAVQYSEQFTAAEHDVLHYTGSTRNYDLNEGAEGAAEQVVLVADDESIQDSFRAAYKVLTQSVAEALRGAKYEELKAGYLAETGADALEDDEIADLRRASKTWVAALGLVPEIVAGLEAKAAELGDGYYKTYARKFLHSGNDEMMQRYSRYGASSGLGEPRYLSVPEADQVAGKPAPGRDYTAAEQYRKHVLSDAEGISYYGTGKTGKINDLERAVLDRELADEDAVAWYRNGTGGPTSLGIAYEMGGRTRLVYPDLLIVSKHGGGLAVDVVDPHRVDLADALPKLRGLADYAEAKPAGVRTVIAVSSEIEGVVYTLDLGTEAARKAVREASDATAPYLAAGVALAG